MNDDSEQEDDLLRELADVAKERASDDEAWEKLARGELSDEEAAALGAELPPEEAEAMRALYAPIDPLVKARIARDAARQAPRKERTWIAPAFGALTVAALVLFVAWPRSALPDYAVELSEGAAIERGDSTPSRTYRTDDRLQLVLRPETEVEGEVQVEVLDGETRWEGPIEVAPTGAVRIAGRAGELFETGTHMLTFVVHADGDEKRYAVEIEVRE